MKRIFGLGFKGKCLGNGITLPTSTKKTAVLLFGTPTEGSTIVDASQWGLGFRVASRQTGLLLRNLKLNYCKTLDRRGENCLLYFKNLDGAYVDNNSNAAGSSIRISAALSPTIQLCFIALVATAAYRV